MAVLYVGIMGAGSCGKDATKRIDLAKNAISDAKDANAEEIAPTELKSAEESLLEAEDLFDKYKFKNSEEEAIIAETQARLAESLALKGKVEPPPPEPPPVVLPTEKELALRELKTVFFALDSYVLSDHANSILENNAKWLVKLTTINIKIEGHCDDRGTEEYNMALGANRARAVYESMVAAGVDKTRLSTISYGESFPVDTGQDEEAWAKNRRAIFKVSE